ncbi:glycosyltransferase family 2 protein [uncultured Dialister sp.]|jgi:glycosyltransferase involved in cell wall biosynthesis|uniref:glycosyltransferase family 2 protein n=1 Tax=uncultured Dialister sp. TaxID=278064 RepID=UPI00262CB99B|nr:glycosyltransferase family 2 protein [uncultured Dialister sp.]
MNPRISVIVPVYKVEQYLSRCVESLLSQTYKNFEIILVDDGSPDICPVMCDEYEEKYKKIRTLHKKNGGLSDARNAGMKIARGEYVTFVDSDDYVNPLYLELLVDGIKKGANLSVCGFTEVYDGDSLQELSRAQITIPLLDARKGLVEVLYQGFHDVSAWGILLPYKLAKKYPFPKGKLFEDLYTTYHFYFDSDQVAFIRAPLYYYFQRKDSIMRQRNESFICDLMEASDLLVKACKGKGKDIEKAAMNKQFSNYCRLILQPSPLKDKYPNQYQHIVNTLKNERFSILLDNRARKKNRMAALALMGGVAGLKLAFKLN